MDDQVAEIPLTQGFVAIIDAADLSIVQGYSWHVAKRRHTNYAAAWIPGTRQKVLMHRLIVGAKDRTIEVDHKDGNGLNNRRSSNLRVATKSRNMHNLKKHRDGKSRFKGVFPCPDRPKNPWMAQIHPPGGKNTYLGRFTTEEAAALAYDAAAVRLFGEFARTNFPAEVAA